MLRGLTTMVVFVFALLVGLSSAAAQEAETPVTFGSKLFSGHEMYKSGNFEGALQIYEEAKEMEPGNGVVYYFIGCTLAKLEKLDDAMATLQTAITIAGSKDPGIHAKALFMKAIIAEKRGDLEAIKEAWIAYKGFVQTNTGMAVFGATAEARLSAIDVKTKLDDEYKIVKERISSSN